MTLRDLLQGVTSEPVSPSIQVAGIACHSKQVREGDLFVAIEGSTADGHTFIEEAVRRGAAAIVSQRPVTLTSPGAGNGSTPRSCPCIVVRDTKEALVMMAARFYGHPSRRLRLIGVTGTNGKTTTTYLLKTILGAAGARIGLLGTIVYQIGGRSVPSTNTTPGPLELQRYFAQMTGEGLQWCAMEVSSHALAQGRIAGLEFDAAVFCNLGSDHLDYHKTRDAYASAKRRLFDYLKPGGYAVINVDDAYGRVLADTLPHGQVITYGIEHPATVTVRDLVGSWEGLSLVLESPWGVVPIATPLLGRHNAWNIAAAATGLLAMGVSINAIHDGLAELDQVPGRLEQVPNDLGVNVLIDYAHTADAMRLVLQSLREMTRGRLVVVFGCGGDRDQTKRPVMGKIASLYADAVVLTSDNPRGEDPRRIIRQIKEGFVPAFQHVTVEPDRERAITGALAEALHGDTILIAGKGHEAHQVFHDVCVPFSDRHVVEQWLAARQGVAVTPG